MTFQLEVRMLVSETKLQDDKAGDEMVKNYDAFVFPDMCTQY